MKPAPHQHPHHPHHPPQAHQHPRTARIAPARLPGPSLLGLHAGYRLAIAALAVALLWLCVLWALN